MDVSIPSLGESVTEATIVRWTKAEGQMVQRDEVLLELETDKAGMEITAPESGVVHIRKAAGATVAVGEVIGVIEPGGAATISPPAPKAAAAPAPAPKVSPPPPALEPAAARPVGPLSPAVRQLIAEHSLDPTSIRASGKGGRLTKEDVVTHLERAGKDGGTQVAAVAPVAQAAPLPERKAASPGEEEVVPMSRLRKRIAERLVQAQHTAAILTTFNEIDMSAVMALRSQYKEAFQKKHGVSLGFMSVFARACIEALEELPAVNAEIRDDAIVYKHFVHLGIAVGTERGLVVPVVRHADRLSLAGIEHEIARLAGLARDNKLVPDDLAGGTFTISNGGVYGSLMSTPILNPPQSGILGMHKIEKRPVVVQDQIVIRPMMYVALSYDHRLVDGEQAVTFLVRVKERVEDPARLLLHV